MRVLVDTNIILDVLLNRAEFLEASSTVLKRLWERQYHRFFFLLSPDVTFTV